MQLILDHFFFFLIPVAQPSKYTTWKVDGTTPMYWFIMSPFTNPTFWELCHLLSRWYRLARFVEVYLYSNILAVLDLATVETSFQQTGGYLDLPHGELKKGGGKWVGDEWEADGQSVSCIPRKISERLQVKLQSQLKNRP